MLQFYEYTSSEALDVMKLYANIILSERDDLREEESHCGCYNDKVTQIVPQQLLWRMVLK